MKEFSIATCENGQQAVNLLAFLNDLFECGGKRLVGKQPASSPFVEIVLEAQEKLSSATSLRMIKDRADGFIHGWAYAVEAMSKAATVATATPALARLDEPLENFELTARARRHLREKLDMTTLRDLVVMSDGDAAMDFLRQRASVSTAKEVEALLASLGLRRGMDLPAKPEPVQDTANLIEQYAARVAAAVDGVAEAYKYGDGSNIPDRIAELQSGLTAFGLALVTHGKKQTTKT